MKLLYTPLLLIAAVCVMLSGCEEFIEIDAPRTDLVRSTVFASDVTADAAMTDIYYGMHFNGFASGDPASLSFLGSIAADEQIDYTVALADQTRPFFNNALTPANTMIDRHWNQLYGWIYKSNAIIEGLSQADALTDSVRIRLEGEALFIRAFSHFYLVNLWGQVPLVTSTDYSANAKNSGNGTDEIYDQIVADLKAAQASLPKHFISSSNERTRPNYWAATALLARVYLYRGEWAEAETEATRIIENTSLFALESDLNSVFFKTSREAIWQFRSFTNYPKDISTFYIFGEIPTWGALRPEFAGLYEDGDQREVDWIRSVTNTSGETIYFSSKFKSFTPLTEYTTLLRLAEQYLIRAEARAELENVAGAQDDLNAVKSRASLGNTIAADKSSLLAAILHERRIELVGEWGHRWLDLKRRNMVDDVLQPLKPDWKPTASLFPIPEYQVLNSPVPQNPGY